MSGEVDLVLGPKGVPASQGRGNDNPALHSVQHASTGARTSTSTSICPRTSTSILQWCKMPNNAIYIAQYKTRWPLPFIKHITFE